MSDSHRSRQIQLFKETGSVVNPQNSTMAVFIMGKKHKELTTLYKKQVLKL